MPRQALLIALRAATLTVLLLLAAGPGRAAERANIEASLDVTGFGVAIDGIALTAAEAPRLRRGQGL